MHPSKSNLDICYETRYKLLRATEKPELGLLGPGETKDEPNTKNEEITLRNLYINTSSPTRDQHQFSPDIIHKCQLSQIWHQSPALPYRSPFLLDKIFFWAFH